MTRALSLTCLVLLAFAGSAFAKPKIAVLGIEVQDQSSTQVGKDLTDQLRAQARSGSGKYELASNSDKELVDEKLMNSCDTELPACMAPIGAAIGASRLLYGHVRKVAGNYIVDLQLLIVDQKQREKAFSNQRISEQDAADPVKLGTFAKNLYKSITSETSTGTLIVEVQNKDVDKGRVQIDGDEKGFLTSGRLPIQNVSDGKHTLVVEVGGFQPFSKEVTVVANDRITVPVTLTPDNTPGGHLTTEGTESQNGGTNFWKPMFVAGTVLAIAGGSFWAYAYFQESSAEGKINHYIGTMADIKANPVNATPDRCGDNVETLFPADGDNDYNQGAMDSRKAFTDACHFRNYTKYGIAATSVGVVIMLGTFYSAWLKDDGETQPKNDKVGRRTTKSGVSITPVFSPNGGGATLRFDW